MVTAVKLAALIVYCIDVGSITEGHFGWARADASGASVEEHHGGSQITDVVGALAGDLTAGRPVALGFECPLFVPVPHDHQRLGLVPVSATAPGQRAGAWALWRPGSSRRHGCSPRSARGLVRCKSRWTGAASIKMALLTDPWVS
jgi:hypothetical protein